jgi:DNA processing protein
MPTELSARAVLAILALPGCGRKSAHRLIRGLTVIPSKPLEWADVLAEVGRGLARFRPPSVEAVSVAFDDADEVLRLAQASGIDVHPIGSQSYPARLQGMPDPPLVLFTKGNWSSLAAGKSLALIGTRKPSPKGVYAARRIGKHLAEKESVVVSGLAMGCDAEGHRGCLEGGGKGVAYTR